MKMRSQKRTRRFQRRGAVALIVALSLIAIFGIVAIAIDGGMLLDNKRRVQSAADAAAMAAAIDLFENYGTNNGLDPKGTAAASAITTAAANGYPNSGSSSVIVNIPPASGNLAGTSGYAEVIITLKQTRFFSSVLGSGAIPVTARAVAQGNPGDIGILLLDLHLMDAGEIDGNINVLNGGKIYSNSDNTVANDNPNTGSVFVDTTSTLSTGGINVRGSLVNTGSITYTNNGGLKTYTNPIADPLANVPEPTTAGLTNYGNVTVNGDTTLSPGVYTNITIKKGKVTLAPGLYYLDSGGSLVLSAGSIQGAGVMFFDNTGGDKILNKANGVVNLSPPTPTSGGSWPTGTTSATYNGISFWIPRSQTKEVHIESTFNLTISGTWYAQGGEYDIRPDGANTIFSIGNYICDQAEWGQGFDNSKNKSNGIININPGTAFPTKRPRLVE